MNRHLLKAARDRLRISDVALRGSRVELADNFEPKYEKLPTRIQLMQQIRRSEVLALKNDGGEREVFRVFVKMGIRWVRADQDQTSDDANSADDRQEPNIAAIIEAIFIAEYEITEEVEQPALDEFATHNAPWHIWPYWREYVANQCARLNIPKATMPMQCLAPKKEGPEREANS